MTPEVYAAPYALARASANRVDIERACGSSGNRRLRWSDTRRTRSRGLSVVSIADARVIDIASDGYDVSCSRSWSATVQCRRCASIAPAGLSTR